VTERDSGMSPEPRLEDVLHIELVALLVEGVVVAPCPWPMHAPWAWWTDAGELACTICDPPARGSR
jgi:hypothetical protein